MKPDSGGEGGIRTRGGLLTLTRFPGVRLKPLIHLSEARYSSAAFGGFQFSATFLPSLYTYSVIAGFLSSPLGSKATLAVTPW
jgi:hypothetical protein